MKPELISLQFAIFLDDFLEEDDIEKILTLCPNLAQIPTKNPIPKDDDLKYVPWVVVANQEVEIRIARKRIDYIYSFTRAEQASSNTVEKKLVELYKGLNRQYAPMINRLSFVARFFIEAPASAAASNSFTSSFKSIIRDGNIATFGARLSVKTEQSLGEDFIFKLNDYLSADSGSWFEQRGIVVQRDFNTATESADDHKGKFGEKALTRLIAFGKNRYNLGDWARTLGE